MITIGIGDIFPNSEPDYGEVRLDDTFWAAFTGVFISACINYPILYGFRYVNSCFIFSIATQVVSMDASKTI